MVAVWQVWQIFEALPAAFVSAKPTLFVPLVPAEWSVKATVPL